METIQGYDTGGLGQSRGSDEVEKGEAWKDLVLVWM